MEKEQKLGEGESVRSIVYKEEKQVIEFVVKAVEDLLQSKSSPLLAISVECAPVLDSLVQRHKKHGVSFKNLRLLNIHEYYPIEKEQIQSHWAILHECFVDSVDIPKENVFTFDATPKSREELKKYLSHFESTILGSGGIDLLVTTIGSSGRIGFNESFESSKDSVLLAQLSHKTRVSAASDFFHLDAVPSQGFTLGMSSILSSKRILVTAFGEGKAKIVREIVEGKLNAQNPASYLQQHNDVTLVIDSAAGELLTRINTPWLLKTNINITALKESLVFNERMARKAVIWLSLTCKKPILRLSEEDYTLNNLVELLHEHGPKAYDLNVKVFRYLRDTVTGWPGGKQSGPTTGKNTAWPKRVIVFSPHPDDDVISMGGTLARLVQQGHDVHVCYQTSGNIAVWDHDVQRHVYFVLQFLKNNQQELGGESAVSKETIQNLTNFQGTLENFIQNKKLGTVDSRPIQKIKGLIRNSEAWSAARNCGVNVENIHFLDLPFYETGKVKKNPLGQKDIDLVLELLRIVKPHQIYAAGDLSDPHGTHRVCLSSVLEASKVAIKDEWWKEAGGTEVWLYRGAWQEWEPERIKMAVPMSPKELMDKRLAIFKHQSQKDTAPFPGGDPREFWQRSESRNRETAQLYDKLGLQEYEAIEAFVMWNVEKECILGEEEY